MDRLHILVPVLNATLESLKNSHLASLRLRLQPLVQAAEKIGFLITIGAVIPGETKLIVVGKIGEDVAKIYGVHWVRQLIDALNSGARVLIDYTDHHLVQNNNMSLFYRSLLNLEVGFIVPNTYLAQELKTIKPNMSEVYVIRDMCEYTVIPPKVSGNSETSALWFGHSSNLLSLLTLLRNWPKAKKKSSLTIVSNKESVQALGVYSSRNSLSVDIAFVEWSVKAVREFANKSDFSVIPFDLKSPKRFASTNRLNTALTLGLPVCATAIPSYNDLNKYFENLDSNSLTQMIENPEMGHPKVLEYQREVYHLYSIDKVSSDWENLLSLK